MLTRKVLKALAISAGVSLALVACSSGADQFEPSVEEDVNAVEDAGVTLDAVGTLPVDLQAAFDNLDQPISSTPYMGDWAPRSSPPWTIGYASNYAGNSWQAAAKSRLFDELLPLYQEAGLIEDVIITESGADDTVQNQQIRQLVDQGVDLILLCCSNTEALNNSIEYAFEKGVPTVSYSGYTSSKYGLNTSANYFVAGYTQAESIFKKIGGEGNVLNVIGLAGAASSDSFDSGVLAAAKEYPGISLLGPLEGAWNDTVTKTEVQQFLATNSTQVDGMVVQPASATGALQALQSSGRPIVPISVGGEMGALCYWTQNPDWVDESFNVWPPGNEMQAGFEIGVRTLMGQGPKIQSIVRGLPPLTFEQAKEAVGPDCDTNNNGWYQPPASQWFSNDMLNGFFETPANPLG